VIALVGLSDVIFAVDSIPAIFAITCNPFCKMRPIDVLEIPVAISLGVVVSILTITIVVERVHGAEDRRAALAVMSACDKTGALEEKKHLLRGKNALRDVFRAVLFAPQGACEK
jgi:hypothetical protein